MLIFGSNGASIYLVLPLVPYSTTTRQILVECRYVATRQVLPKLGLFSAHMHLVDSLIPGAIPVYISRFSLELLPNMHEKMAKME